MSTPGENILTAAKACQREMTLIAPFIKCAVLARVLEETPPTVIVRVVARWIPKEVAAGVCDLEIYDLLQKRKNSRLYLNQLNHSKLYRFDDRFLFGSANLTSRALGWAFPSNIELLPSVPGLDEMLIAFEQKVLKSSFSPDEAFRDAIRNHVNKLKEATPSLGDELIFDEDVGALPSCWLPSCREPDRVWQVYSKGEGMRSRIIQSAFEAAESDLKALSLEPGLTLDQFRSRIAGILEAMPLINDIELGASLGLSDDAAIAMLEAKGDAATMPHAVSEMWEILRAWLMYFFPDRYRREAKTEVFRTGKVLY